MSQVWNIFEQFLSAKLMPSPNSGRFSDWHRPGLAWTFFLAWQSTTDITIFKIERWVGKPKQTTIPPHLKQQAAVNRMWWYIFLSALNSKVNHYKQAELSNGGFWIIVDFYFLPLPFQKWTALSVTFYVICINLIKKLQGVTFLQQVICTSRFSFTQISNLDWFGFNLLVLF